MELLKSHFELLSNHGNNLAQWEEARKFILNHPEYEGFRRAAAILDTVLARNRKSHVFQLAPAEFYNLLSQHGEELINWRRSGKLRMVIPEALHTLATTSKDSDKKASSENEDGKKNDSAQAALVRSVIRRNREFKKFLAAYNAFSFPPKEPTLTLPDPIAHPRQVVLDLKEKDIHILTKNISRNSPANKARLILSTELIHVVDGHIELRPTDMRVRADKRLLGLTLPARKGDSATLYDSKTGTDYPVLIGGLRLCATRNDPEFAIFDVKLSIKRERLAEPEWVEAYRDSLENNSLEPKLPEKIIVCSFIHDIDGLGYFKAVDFSKGTESHERAVRTVCAREFVKERTQAKVQTDREQVQRVPLDSISVPKDILTHRRTIERLNRKLEKETNGREIKKLERKIRKLWNHHENSTDDRANIVAAGIVSQIEALRSEFPDREVVLVREYRTEFKPNQTWSRDFNRLLMSSTSGKLYAKLDEVCGDRPRAIPTFALSTFGITSVRPGTEDPSALRYRVQNDHKKTEIIPDGKSDQVAVIEQEGDGTIKVVADSVFNVQADNLINRFIAPHLFEEISQADIVERQEELWKNSVIVEEIAKLTFTTAAKQNKQLKVRDRGRNPKARKKYYRFKN